MGTSTTLPLRWIWAILGLLLLTTTLCVQGSPFNEDEGLKSYAGYKLLRTEPISNMQLADSLLALDGMQGEYMDEGESEFTFCIRVWHYEQV
jgi:hypothetical protein